MELRLAELVSVGVALALGQSVGVREALPQREALAQREGVLELLLQALLVRLPAPEGLRCGVKMVGEVLALVVRLAASVAAGEALALAVRQAAGVTTVSVGEAEAEGLPEGEPLAEAEGDSRGE